MSKKVRQLGFCLLAIAAIAAFAAPAAHAFDLSYTQAGFGNTMTQACNNAIQRIDDNCDAYGAITTDPVGCWPLWDIHHELIGYICKCEATAAYCQKLIGGPFS